MEREKEEIFGKEFFDGNKGGLGVYRCYPYENIYPECKILSSLITDRFSPLRVLDIGCAKGFLVKALNDQGVDAWGVDISDYAISTSSEDIRPRLHAVDLNTEPLPFEDESFDFITFLGTIEYLNDYEYTIREARRVLKEGGFLFLKTIYKRNPQDHIRMNIHDKDHWIKEFQVAGFDYMSDPDSFFIDVRMNYLNIYLNCTCLAPT